MAHRDFSMNYCDLPVLDMCHSFPKWPANPDIAGVGVITAFCVTSLVTLVAIVTGYFRGWIRDEQKNSLLNDLDHQIIEFISRREATYPRNDRDPSRDALERFVLSLSDQQLASGVAILSIGYIQHCSLSSYHFFVIVALAWFSSTTHLSTLSVLQYQLNRNAVLKYTRIIGMILVYTMLMVGLLVIYVDEWFQVPVQCRLENMSSALGSKRPLTNLVAVFLMGFLTFSYLSKLLGLIYPAFHVFKKTGISTSRRNTCRKKLRHLSNLNFPSVIIKTWQFISLFNYVFLEFMDSFLWQICWMLFGNIFGIRFIIWARQVVRSHIIIIPPDAETELSFGQLLALLLLIIPLFAAVEAYEEAKMFRQIQTRKIEGMPQLVSDIYQNDEIGAAHDDTHSASNDSSFPQPNDADPMELNRLVSPPLEAPGLRRRYTIENLHPPRTRDTEDELSHSVELMFAAIFLYTLATLVMAACYFAWDLKGHEAGVIISFAMTGILFIAALFSYASVFRDSTKDYYADNA